IFPNPNAPTGMLLGLELIKQLLEKNTDSVVVVDEAYIDFCDFPSWSTVLDAYPNLIITQTLSKAFGMAGLRLGIAIASPEIIALLKRIKPPYNINTLSQQSAMGALSDTKTVNAQIAESISERNRLEKELIAFSWVKQIYPSDANFLLLKVDDAAKRYAQFLDKHIVLRDRSSQENCENCIRISIGTPQENNQLLTAFKSLDE
ncbi:MAG: pyridoxal phosphate-dependent aminotransferase, partial [Flavobacteriaceae bacterium]